MAGEEVNERSGMVQRSGREKTNNIGGEPGPSKSSSGKLAVAEQRGGESVVESNDSAGGRRGSSGRRGGRRSEGENSVGKGSESGVV